ncbi:MAG: imidazolonepropionase [Acidimicrobiia bacterium]|nr:imidazolonepropionase [Acidimicrobiia bacterium]NNJ47718.1 imidazolonepropionase [Acidimicrobiia bacterium]
MTNLLLTGIGELVTNDPEREGLLGVVTDAAVAVKGGRIAWVGPETELLREFRELPELDGAGRAVLPGFVDSHTHLVFGGNRADEFARRVRGESYEEIMAAGGGIMSTVASTRATDSDTLLDEAVRRAQRMLGMGTTTVEVKSGYGLEVETELRMLEVANSIAEYVPIDVVTTFLGAHVVPAEYEDDRDAYLRLIVEEMLPAAGGMATFCDVFCDDGAFAVDEARVILAAAAEQGLAARLHANQLGHSGGASLAAELGAITADHLDHLTDADIAGLLAAGTVAVLFPTVSFSLRLDPPPARRLWDAGVPVAIATDCNPGTSYIENMQFVIAAATLTTGLTPEESVWAATRGGARALQFDDRGWIKPGTVADLVMLEADSYLEIPYRPGTDLVRMVIKGGEAVVS